ncbi:somatostatin receptor type 2-like [Glandiceps talaboti]
MGDNTTSMFNSTYYDYSDGNSTIENSTTSILSTAYDFSSFNFTEGSNKPESSNISTYLNSTSTILPDVSISVFPSPTLSPDSTNDRAAVSIALPTAYGIISVSGFIGNLLVILVLLLYSKMKMLPNIYILNLATADFLFMLTIPFISHQFVTTKWIFGNAMCKFVMSFDGMNQFTGVFLLTAMSLDRYMALKYPMKSLSIRTVRNTRLICIMMWVLSVLVSLPLWLYSETSISESSNETLCSLSWSGEVYQTFILYAFMLGYVFPLLIISSCYISIIRLMIRNKQPGEKGMSRRGSKRVAILVIVTVLTFAICWLPFYVMQLHFTFFVEQKSLTKGEVIAHYTSICLSYGNSAINPIIYTFVGRNFKEGIVRLLCCKGDLNDRSQSAFHSNGILTHITQTGRSGIPSSNNAKRNVVYTRESSSRNVNIISYDNTAFQGNANELSPENELKYHTGVHSNLPKASRVDDEVANIHPYIDTEVEPPLSDVLANEFIDNIHGSLGHVDDGGINITAIADIDICLAVSPDIADGQEHSYTLQVPPDHDEETSHV